MFLRPVEVDATCVGSLERLLPAKTPKRPDGGVVGKVSLIGTKDHGSKRVSLLPLKNANPVELQAFVP